MCLKVTEILTVMVFFALMVSLPKTLPSPINENMHLEVAFKCVFLLYSVQVKAGRILSLLTNYHKSIENTSLVVTFHI